ncbi:general substrate transporter [Dipodascopsis uninucleata]
MLKVYNVYLVALSATVGGMLFGFDISSVSAFVDNAQYLNYFNHPDSTRQGGITAAMSGGSFMGSLASGAISDRLGRKYAIQIGAIIWMVGAAVQCSSQNVAQLVCGRIISGVAIGICSSQVPVYLAELAPKRIRGRLVGLFQWAVTWGIMIMFYISYGCSFINGPAAFRTAWGLQMVPGLVLFSTLMLFPESPRWLATHDRWDECLNIIRHVQGDGSESDTPEIQLEISEIREAVRIEKLSKDVSLLDLFAKGSRLRTLAGVSGQIWQQMCGMNVMMYYVVYTFAMAGYQGNANLVASSIQYVINVVMTIPALLFIDRWGRRPLLIYGGVIMATFLFLVGGIMAAHGHYVPEVNGNENIRWIVPNSQAAKAVIAFNYLFVATFSPTWGPGIWIYVSEIFPLKQRAVANGFCASFNWIFNFALAFFVPPAFRNIQWKTFIIFGVMCIAMVINVYFLFPETMGKSLEEIDLIWSEHIPAWKSKNVDLSAYAANRNLLKEDEKDTKVHEHHENTDANSTTAPTISEQDANHEKHSP